MAVVLVENLSVGYDGRTVCENLNFTVEEGDYVCIVGKNGTGKSTLVKTLLGLLPPVNGKIEWPKGGKKRIGYLPQRDESQKSFPATVWEIVMSGRLNRTGFFPFFKKEDKRVAREIAEGLGIMPLAKRSFCELSGGQQQKVMLARALCSAENLIILDEPVAGLDPIATEDMYLEIKRLNEQGMTVMMVTHDAYRGLDDCNKVLDVGTDGNFFGSASEYAAHKNVHSTEVKNV